MAIDARRRILTPTGARTRGEDEELASADVVDFALRRHFRLLARLCGGVRPQRQGDDVLVRERRVRGLGYVVFEQARLATDRVVGPAVVDERGLRERIQGFAIRRGGQTFETLIVRAARLRVGGNNGAVWFVNGRAVGGERDRVVATRDIGGRWSDSAEQFSGCRESVDVGAIFVADPEAAVIGEHKAFGIDTDAAATSAGLAEAIAGVGGGGEEGEVADCEAASKVGVEAGGWVALGVSEEEGALVV